MKKMFFIFLLFITLGQAYSANRVLEEMTKPVTYGASPTLTVDEIMQTRSFTLEDLGVGEKREASVLEQVAIGMGDAITNISLVFSSSQNKEKNLYIRELSLIDIVTNDRHSNWVFFGTVITYIGLLSLVALLCCGLYCGYKEIRK